MAFAHWALLISGGLVLAGIAYPSFARQQPGWKIGAGAGGIIWSVWYGTGALAYLGGMAQVFGWIGIVAAVPLALIIGFAIVMAVKRRTLLVALVGPILANLWFIM